MAKPPLWVVQPYPLVPADSGGKTRQRATVLALRRAFRLEVNLFYSRDNDRRLTQTYLNALKIPVRFFKTRPKSSWSFFRYGIPYWFSDWVHPSIGAQLTTTANRNRPVLVEYSQLLYLAGQLPPGSQKIFTAYDVATVSFGRRLRAETNWLKKLIGSWRWLEVFLYERYYLPKFDRVVAVSDHDAHILKKYFGCRRLAVIPNGIDRINFLPLRKKDGYINIGFIGSTGHPPNRQAIEFLIGKIAPALSQQRLKFRIILAGTWRPDQIPDRPEVVKLGFVGDLAEFYRQLDVLVVPLWAGSGSRIKILESLSYGRGVIASTTGAEGLTINSPWLRLIPQAQVGRGVRWLTELINWPPTGDLREKTRHQLEADLTRWRWDRWLGQLEPILTPSRVE